MECQFAGYLTKKGGNVQSLKHRYFVLRNQWLYYFESKGSDIIDPLGSIALKNATALVKMPIDPTDEASKFGFIVFDPERIWELYADSEEQRAEWMGVLKPLIGNPQAILDPRLVAGATIRDREWKKCWCVISDDSLLYFESEVALDRFLLLAPANGSETPEILLQTATGFVKLRPCTAQKVGAHEGHENAICINLPGGKQFFMAAENHSHVPLWIEAIEAAAGPDAAQQLQKYQSSGSVAAMAKAAPQLGIEKTGYLTKKGGNVKTLKRRFFVLRKGSLFYYENDYEDMLDPIGSIALKNALAVLTLPFDADEPESKFGFTIMDNERMWDMYAADADERDSWIAALKPFITSTMEPLKPRLVGFARVYNPSDKNWDKFWCVISGESIHYFEKESTMDRFLALSPADVSTAPPVLLEIASGQLDISPCSVQRVGMYQCRDSVFCITTKDEKQTFFSVENEEHMAHWLPAIQAAAGPDAEQKMMRFLNRSSVAAMAKVAPQLGIEKTGYLTKKGGSVKTLKRRFFILRKGSLFYYETEHSDITSPLGSIALKQVVSICKMPINPREPPSKYGFTVLDNERIWDIYASDDKERDEWMEALYAALPHRNITSFSARLIGHTTMLHPLLNEWESFWCVVGRDSFAFFEKEDTMDRFIAMAPENYKDAPKVLLDLAVGILPLSPCRVVRAGIYEGRDFTFCITLPNGDQHYASAESDLHMQHFVAAIAAAAGEDAEDRMSLHSNRTSVASTMAQKGMSALSIEKVGFLIKKGGSVKTLKRRYFVLRKQVLYYFVSENSELSEHIGMLHMKKVITISKMQFDPEEPASKFGFCLLEPDRIWEMYAVDDAERDEWMEALYATLPQRDLPAFSPRLIGHATMLHPLLNKWENFWCVVGKDSFAFFEKESVMDRFIVLAPENFKEAPKILLDLAVGFLPLNPCRVTKVGIYEGRDFTFCITLGNGDQHYASAESDLHLQHFMNAITSAAGENAEERMFGHSHRSSIGAALAQLSVDLNIEKTGYLIKKGGTVKSLKRRFFVLRKQTFYYFVSDHSEMTESIGSVALKKVVSVSKMQFDPEEPASKYGFCLLEPERIWEMYAVDEAERDDWINALAPIIARNNIPQFVPRFTGWATKQGGSFFTNWQRRYFVIGDDVMAYFESELEGQRFAAMAPKMFKDLPENLTDTASGVLPLRGNVIQKIGTYDGHEYCLIITTNTGRKFFFSTESATDMNRWYDIINSVSLSPKK